VGPAGAEGRRRALRPGFALVFRRELRWLRRRPVLLFFTTALPLFLMSLFTVVFSAGLPTELPVAVLDRDGTDLSRAVIRMVDATSEIAIVEQVDDLAQGRHLILSGNVYCLLMLPLNLQRDAFAGRRPEVVFFYDNQHMTVGGILARGATAAVGEAGAGVQVALRDSQGEPVELAQAAIVPIPIHQNTLFNPALNYAHFLLAALLPAVLQIIVVTTSAYSVGLDIEGRYRLAILRRLGGGMWSVLFGKLLPHTVVYLVIYVLGESVLFDYLEMPLRGHAWLLVLAAILFIFACQLLGMLLVVVTLRIGTALSIAGLITAPAFGFMGVGFPRLGMNEFAHAWGALLPGTWYLQARVDQTIRGTPLDLSLPPIVVLAAFVFVLACLCALRLDTLRRRRLRRLERPDPALAAGA
jgi:ABC-2 type transport system permease protein